MSKLIRTTGVFPPGGYAFRDGITGKNYDEMHITFEERVQQVIRDRSANARLFTDPKFVSVDYVADEISRQICSRIHNNPMYCTDGPGIASSSPNNLTAPEGKKCTCGSADLEVLLCSSCGGRKVEGYRCRACGNRLAR